ncbi:MAG: amidohydrolase family protein [Gemmatimonadota bacterium]
MSRVPSVASKSAVCGTPALSVALATLLIWAPSADAQVAVRAGTLHTMAGPAIENGVVVVGADGRIQAVGPASSVQIPQGMRVMEAAVVTPGLVDAHSVVGLAGYLNQPHDQDQLERSNAIQPELRAFDAYNAREELVSWVQRLGVTTLHTGHGPGALMSGQTMVVKTRGDNVGQALVDSVTMVAMTLGPEVSQNFQGRPGSRSRGVAMLRAEFIKAQEYQARQERAEDGPPPARDLKLEILGRMLDGEVHALITANRVSEILAALRLSEEFGFSLVLDGAAESYLLIDEIRAAGVPVIIHPTMARHGGTMENATLETARILVEAGIPVSMQTGFEGYVPKSRVLLFEGAMAAAYGLPHQEALASMTIRPAQLLGLDHRVGSLEVGKDGDLVLYSGDPLEHLTQVCGVIIEGEVVSEECL